jgi:hypothetical protein
MTLLPTNITRCMSPADQRACSPSGRTPAEARAAAVAKDERELQRQVANYLRLLGVWFSQARMDRRTTATVGTPDFVFPYRGRYIAWETKCPWSRSLRPEQAFAREGIERQGGEWRLITTLAEAQAHLREMDAVEAANNAK